ncbi:MAG: hypothetical protein NZ761_01560 [Dehalococcoidia bacterium]|nr:hypothetical protein [Dehalococcoidia bacterium]
MGICLVLSLGLLPVPVQAADPGATASAALPDLTIRSIRVRQGSSPGSYQVEVEVRNQGRSASGETALRLSLRRSGTNQTRTVGDFPVPALQPRQTTTIPAPVTVPDTTHRYTLIAEVDPENRVVERRENNNRRTRLLPRPRPGTPPPPPAPSGNYTLEIVGRPRAVRSDECTTLEARLRRDGVSAIGIRILYQVTEGPHLAPDWRVLGVTDDLGAYGQLCGQGAVGVDRLEACADVNDNGRCDDTEPRATEGIWFGFRDDVRQSTQAQLLGQSVTVTYCAWLGEQPVANLRVLFRVSPDGGSITPGPREGQATTGPDGCAQFTFRRDNPTTVYGSDRVEACADLDGNGRCDEDLGRPIELRRTDYVVWGTSEMLNMTWYTGASAYLQVVEERRFTVSVYLRGYGIAGQRVLAAWSGAHNGWQAQETAWDGTATFSYTGTRSGVDSIVICLDENRSDTCDAEEERIDFFSTSWIVGAELDTFGAATDTDPETAWSAGGCPSPTAAPVRLVVRTIGEASVPLIVQVRDGSARVALDCSGVVKARALWSWAAYDGIPVFVLNGAPEQDFRVQVWLDRNDNRRADAGELLLVDQTVTLTE